MKTGMTDTEYLVRCCREHADGLSNQIRYLERVDADRDISIDDRLHARCDALLKFCTARKPRGKTAKCDNDALNACVEELQRENTELRERITELEAALLEAEGREHNAVECAAYQQERYERLNNHTAKLESRSISCCFCGCDNESLAALKKHSETCQQHPAVIRAVEAVTERDALANEVERLCQYVNWEQIQYGAAQSERPSDMANPIGSNSIQSYCDKKASRTEVETLRADLHTMCYEVRRLSFHVSAVTIRERPARIVELLAADAEKEMKS